MPRNEKGQYVQTTKTQRYKQIKVKGKYMSVHHLFMCSALGISKIPKGFVVHHIDRNGLNNSIDNLALMNITAHNRIHSHTPWNKGMSIYTNDRWAETIEKAKESRHKNYIPKLKETYDLYNSGLKQREVAEKLGITREQVSLRIIKYKTLIL